MKAPKLTLPKLSLGKASPGALIARLRRDKADPRTESDAGASEAVEDDDVPDYLKPTFAQRHATLLTLAAAYAAFFLAIGGTAAYLFLNEDAIIASEIERRPSITVDPLKPEIVRLDEDGTPEGEDAPGETAAADVETAADGAAPAEESDDTETADASAEGSAEPTEPTESTDESGEEEPVQDLTLLTPNPDPQLVEDGPTGPLPRVGSDGRKPWRVYSRPANALESRPRIAVVVTELGISDDTTEQALGLPGAVTLAFAPYAGKLGERVEAARKAGHEVMLTLPMEPRDFPRSDPGPYALLTSLAAEQNMERLAWVLSRATGYIGVANYQGSGFTADKEALRPVMTVLAERGLAYFDTRENATSDAPRIAQIAGTPATSADIIADQDLSRASILRRLNEAEVIAKANGTAIVVIRPYPLAMSRVKSWARDLGTRGVVLAPLSAVISARAGS